MEELSYLGENSVQKGQNSVFQKNQKRKKREKCPKIKPVSRWMILRPQGPKILTYLTPE